MAEAKPALRRFWTDATAAAHADGWRILLDGKPLRTPARALLTLPGEALALAIAAEWREAGEQIRPTDLPLTGLANAAIDVIPAGRAAIVAGIAAHAGADLTCYRADAPHSLRDRQTAQWEAPLRAVEARHQVQFRRTTGILHVEQPAATLAAMRSAVLGLSDFQLAGVQPLVGISGSLVLVLAQLAGVLTPDAAFRAATLDEDWQQQRWGVDAEAQDRLRARRRDYLAASRLLALLAI